MSDDTLPQYFKPKGIAASYGPSGTVWRLIGRATLPHIGDVVWLMGPQPEVRPWASQRIAASDLDANWESVDYGGPGSEP